MPVQQIINNNPIVLPPTGPASAASLNPLYTACDATNGSYFQTTGRDLVSFYCAPASSAPAWLSTTLYTKGQVVNFGLAASITNIAITTDVLTVTANNTFQVGETVALAGLTTATFLNAQSVTILTATTLQFTANFTHADYASAPDTGTATIPTDSYIALQNLGSNLNIQPTSTAGAAFWAPYDDGSSTVTLSSAPDGCTGRTVPTNNPPLNPYTVPVATEINPGTEFLVLPSSTYTQANQQFQFIASSNLVSVYVRNF